MLPRFYYTRRIFNKLAQEYHERERIILLLLCARQLERSVRSIAEVFALSGPRCKPLVPSLNSGICGSVTN